MWTYNTNYLSHHGIQGQKWGVRRFQNPDGSLTPAGKKRYSGETLFVSGSSKTQTPDSGFYRKKLPIGVRKELKKSIKKGDKIIVGDAPGIDRQVQDYLNKKKYDNVEVYGPGKKVRYSANSKWKTNPIDASEYKEGSKEWLAKKDKEMQKAATKGLAVILDNGGAGATRQNVNNMIDSGKNVKVYKLFNETKNIKDQDITKGVKYIKDNMNKLNELKKERDKKEKILNDLEKQPYSLKNEKAYPKAYADYIEADDKILSLFASMANNIVNQPGATDEYRNSKTKKGQAWLDAYTTLCKEYYL